MNPGAKRLEAVAVKKDVHSIGGGLVRLKNFLCSLPSSISNLYTYKPPNIQGAHAGFPTVQQLDPFIFLKFYQPICSAWPSYSLKKGQREYPDSSKFHLM